MNKFVSFAAVLTLALQTVACAAETNVDAQDEAVTVATEANELTALSAAPAEQGLEATVRDNEVVFVAGDAVKHVAFVFDGAYSITEGQPWEGVSDNSNFGVDHVHVQAGRKGSLNPLSWYAARSNRHDISSILGWSDASGSMNFALTGYLFIESHKYRIVLAQQGSGGRNGWWLSSNEPGWTFDSPTFGKKSLRTPDGLFKITGDGASDSTFDVEKAD
jgi:hypothetical protein